MILYPRTYKYCIFGHHIIKFSLLTWSFLNKNRTLKYKYMIQSLINKIVNIEDKT